MGLVCECVLCLYLCLCYSHHSRVFVFVFLPLLTRSVQADDIPPVTIRNEIAVLDDIKQICARALTEFPTTRKVRFVVVAVVVAVVVLAVVAVVVVVLFVCACCSLLWFQEDEKLLRELKDPKGKDFNMKNILVMRAYVF